ncbi:uncharacterized protein DUF4091 [Chitinophaga skermanii]|uniref:Uncharacterized protein DUF4091 n=1 Tax=Chitinophaga skermanii TaxID=331697 RepID=A0A327Q3I3_9BACT|nr:DUF4091 domain-containing protein [Chitinophaga skermanii]RAI98474.1 uncharacterized protein DUF4091 [Chitinophaga skermanii]
MVKKILLATFCMAMYATAWSQNAKFGAYTELTDPVKPSREAWDTVISGTHVVYGTTDVRYSKTLPPQERAQGWHAVAWKGEKVHTQILVYGTEPLKDLSVELGDLADEKGNKIPRTNIKAGFLRYVLTDGLNPDGSGCGHRPDHSKFDSSLVADGIDYSESIFVNANETQPIWLSVEVPANTAPGKYAGSLRIKYAERYYPEFINYTIEVLNRTLPNSKNWSFHLDLWQSPEAIARLYEVEPWSQAHFDAMRPYMKKLASAGQKVITAAIIHDPWNSQTLDIFGSTVKWTKKKNGTWQYDYTVFDKWVKFMMDCGVNKQINCYSMIPWNLKFYYYDEAMAKDTFIVAKPGTAEFNNHWRPMLQDFVKHLKVKGWFNITNISMDERKMEDMLAALQLIRSVSKDFKVSLAGTYHKELVNEMYDYSIGSAQVMPREEVDMRLKKGWPTTNYTCCSEGYPNTFTFSPPAEATWLPWYSAAKGYNGYLRWAYNNWVEQPLLDSRFRTWAAGDCYLVYPGVRTSIRFERLIEGIQDYEKIMVLKAAAKGDATKLKAIENMLAPFEISKLPTESAAVMLQKAKVTLNSL